MYPVLHPGTVYFVTPPPPTWIRPLSMSLCQKFVHGKSLLRYEYT